MFDRAVRVDKEVEPVAPHAAKHTPVPRRLVVGSADDRLEVEADEVADDLLRRLRRAAGPSDGTLGRMEGIGSAQGQSSRIRRREDTPLGGFPAARVTERPAGGAMMRVGSFDDTGQVGDREVIRRMQATKAVVNADVDVEDSDDEEVDAGWDSLSGALWNTLWSYGSSAYSQLFGPTPTPTSVGSGSTVPTTPADVSGTKTDGAGQKPLRPQKVVDVDNTPTSTTNVSSSAGQDKQEPKPKGKQSSSKQLSPQESARKAAQAAIRRATALKAWADDIGEEHTALDGELDQLRRLKMGGPQPSNPKTINARVTKVTDQIQALNARVEPGWKKRQADLAARELQTRNAAGVLDGRAETAGVDASALALALDELDGLDDDVSLTVRETFVVAVDKACLALTLTVDLAEQYRAARKAAVAALARADTLLPPPPLPNQPPELLHKLRSWRFLLDSAMQRCAKVADVPQPAWSALPTPMAEMIKQTKWVTAECDLVPKRHAGLVSKGDTVIPAMTQQEATKRGGHQEQQRLAETLQCLSNGLKKGSQWKEFPPDGEWGSPHYNLGSGLPEDDTYREYYVRPWKHDVKGSDGLCRVVVGTDGRVWYTRSHYGKHPSEGPAYVLLIGVTRT